MGGRSYRKRGLALRRGGVGVSEQQIRALQRDLRGLGYLKKGIDGKFGPGTELAVRALQWDLLHNDGRSTGGDGNAPMRVLDFNRGRVVEVTGTADQGLGGCIADMLATPDFPVLPKAENPKADNARILAVMRELSSAQVPIPFIMGILEQESGLKHFNEPSRNDEDTYITIGLDTNASEKHIITSRGYGAGQYTLFHHPPRKAEIDDFMLDVEKNLQKAIRELREKFDNFVNGTTSGTRADDRSAEYGDGPLRPCKYGTDDPRFLRDCRQCMVDAGQMAIRDGVTPLYEGSTFRFVPTDYYGSGDYDSVPIRKNIPCDWPYAVRRYNGAGINSYHYQVRVLKDVLRGW
ncbi:MAG TPA: peptidoglycan-binding domain-containing protein [Syntrophobacteria bacterium]|nr:peptidoglycan-binding domain-containing protein [Syntrophobacteria bacterium]